jgi:hypothetical protein
MASKVVVKGLKIIGASLGMIFTKIPNLISRALKSPLAKNILGKYGKKIASYVDSFVGRVKPLIGKITGKSAKEGSEIAGKGAIKEVSGGILQKQFTIKGCTNMRLCNTKVILQSFSKKLHAKVTYTMDDFSYSNIGAGMSFQFRKVNFYGMFDNILSYRNLSSANSVSLQLGVNFIMN